MATELQAESVKSVQRDREKEFKIERENVWWIEFLSSETKVCLVAKFFVPLEIVELRAYSYLLTWREMENGPGNIDWGIGNWCPLDSKTRIW